MVPRGSARASRGGKREQGEARKANALAAPATVSGEAPFQQCHWLPRSARGPASREDGTAPMTREPGDLPPGSSSAVAGGLPGGRRPLAQAFRVSVFRLSPAHRRHAAGVAVQERQDTDSMTIKGWGAVAALTLVAFAAASAHAEEAIVTEELLVSGGVEPIPTKEVASSYTIVTAEEIEKFQYQDITDALRSVPGLHVVPSGSRGTVTSVFTRGANSNQTLVLVNGTPINDPSSPGGAANLAGITLDNVERIEVVRGPQSSLYGSQALGGG